MVGDISPDFACGQVLFGLKMSNLNYVVKETPYSVYLTIRKSFVREPVERQSIEIKDSEKALKEEIKELKTNLAIAKFELDEIEVKHESLKEENKRLEETIEDLDDEKNILIKDIKAMSEERESLKVRIRDVTKQKDEVSNKFENLKRVKNKEYAEKNDMLNILESTLDNKCQEIKKLQKELEILQGNEYNCDICSFACNLEHKLEEHMDEKHNYNSYKKKETSEDVATTSKCGKCDYESEEESDLINHIESYHQLKCNICGFECCTELALETHIAENHIQIFECETCKIVCKSEEKLKKHICRVTVRNPSFCDFYTNNWITVNRCTSIYHRKKEEVAVFHCKDCMENINRCTGKFPLWLPAQQDETDGIWHLELTKFLKDGRIDWKGVKTLVKDEQTH